MVRPCPFGCRSHDLRDRGQLDLNRSSARTRHLNAPGRITPLRGIPARKERLRCSPIRSTSIGPRPDQVDLHPRSSSIELAKETNQSECIVLVIGSRIESIVRYPPQLQRSRHVPGVLATSSLRCSAFGSLDQTSSRRAIRPRTGCGLVANRKCVRLSLRCHESNDTSRL